MNPLALLLAGAAVLVWLSRWVTLHTGDVWIGLPASHRWQARALWWRTHGRAVHVACTAVAAAALVTGVVVG